MSKEEEKESVAFGDFSFDEVKVLLNDNESAVLFSDPVSVGGNGGSSDSKRHQYSTAAAPNSPGGLYPTTIAPPTVPPTFPGPPEFLFSIPSADYTKNYQFGSLPTTLVMSVPQVGSFVSAGPPLNSVSGGRGPVRLNVFAKEFVPTYVPPHLSIISKGEGVVMGGAYTMPPIIPQPFMFSHPSYGAPPIIYPTIPLQMMGHTHVGIRPSGGAGPQVAVVAPYRAAHEARPLFVPPEKNYERMGDSMSDETGGGGSNQIKSLSLSPQATPTAMPTTARSSSVGDVRGLGTSNNDNVNGRSQGDDEENEVKVDDVQQQPTDDQEVLSDSKGNSSSPSGQSPPPPPTPPSSPPTFPSADVNSTDSIPKPAQNESTISPIDTNINNDCTTTMDDTCNNGRPLDEDTGDTGQLDHTNDTDQWSPPQDDKPHPQCNKPHPSNDKPHPPNDKHIIESQSDSVTISNRPHPSNDKSHPSNVTVSDKPHLPSDKSNGKGATGNSSLRSWAAVVGKNSQQAPPTSQGPRPNKDSSSKVGMASKPGGMAEGLSKDELSKLEEMKIQRLKHFGRQLEGRPLNHNSISILPRGLLNSSNHCFIHAPLQALISCPEFTNLLRSLSLPKTPSNDASSLATIVTENMVKFIEHFSSTYPLKPSYDSNGRRKKLRDFSYEKPFRPDFIYEILPKIKSSLSIQGRQEDAEEFLSCFLNKLHEEMVAAKQSVLTPPPTTSANETQELKTGDNERGGAEEEEEWQEVGPKNKSTITRQTEYLSSPISEIFGGRYHSTLHRQGMKVSATVEPFFSLLLDIKQDSVKSVRDALELLATKEPVDLPEKDGVRYSIGATRRTTLIHLPHILILQLKRFIFEGSKCLKLHKNISYDHELEIPKELLAPPVKGKITASQRSYTLWAIVYHCGESPNGGHYITEAYHQQYGGWLRYDDNYVKPVNSDQLFRLAHRVPYLFFYRQSESGASGSLGFTNSASNHHTSGGSGRY
ncbi:PREDICTED: ubiquitin carboxyl-terminal hydrolase 10-A-like isoform X1 [Amphimedon queenslandica]|uniref:ubiquitinyl hydrolase 1 n=1 Tax=Amphimedon queenslandica TaxID=400682 RepID=A0AAN0IYE5_AMPQE|nr:PREDICTED: ubiquitin carboxyl-terminal hydrolase 10-A-like isoform X1 [Amphimedon queenslandica]|eukprot:XP_019849471.1 PREDICTED: ubiquitin carboxyl-terminal hydrolase 10-A-like isoform X1 [Amphimedon queenslandica]